MERSNNDNIEASSQRARGFVGSALGRIGRRLESRETLADRDRRLIVGRLFHEAHRQRPFRRRFALLMALSAAIATLGVVSNSTAVVIGAMLVAPLMTPVLGVAAAIVMGWPKRIVNQGSLVSLASIIAIAVAIGIALVVPWHSEPLPTELIARTSPNLLDLGIALAAGSAGAYGQVRRQASDALIGVAVAVALVPPLAVVGITLQLAEYRLAVGALLLFLANVTGIVMSAGLTFILVGFVPGKRLLTGSHPIASGIRWATVAVILIIIPMQFGRGSVLAATDPTSRVAAAVEAYIGEGATTAELVSVSVEIVDGVTDVYLVVATSATAPSAEKLASLLAGQLDTTVQVNLQVIESEVKQATVTGP